MVASLPAALPAAVVEILQLVDPLRRPRPVELDAALRAELDLLPSSDRAGCALAIAEWLLPRCTSCDVAYTFNVLGFSDFALDVSGGLRPIAARAHLVAARARSFHQPGDRAENLTRAGQHLDAASLAGAPVSDPRLWAAALLDVARAGELAGGHPGTLDPERLYEQILATTDASAGRYRQIVSSRASRRPAPDVAGGVQAASIEALFPLLDGLGDDILPFELAPAATRLGLLYLSRAARGDGNRARRWIQAAERSFYYDPRVSVPDFARNQLAFARYLSAVSVADPDDQEYVLNKALSALDLGYRLGGTDADAQADCFLIAARLWARRDRDRAAGFLADALDLPGVSTAVRGRLELERARSLGSSSPENALAALDCAIPLLQTAPDAEGDLLDAMLVKSRLLITSAGQGSPRDAAGPVPPGVVDLMRDVAHRRTERGDLYDAYSAHRTLAQWSMGRQQFAAALSHYEECRLVAGLIIDRDLNALADATREQDIDDERRAALIENPPPALLAAHRAHEVAVQVAGVDHQVAAYCAAMLGRFDEALRWMLGSRLRLLTATGRVQADLASAPCPDADQVVAVPIVADRETIVLLYSDGRPVEPLTLPLTHTQLRRMVLTDSADLGPVTGWVGAYHDSERHMPALSPAPIDEPQELWWSLLRAALTQYGQCFAEPLLAGLAARGVSASRLLLVPSGLQSFLPLHAVEVGDGTFVADRFALQLGFTPSLPRPRLPAASAGPGTALVMRGDNELVYTGLETRTIGRLLGEKAIAVTAQAARRADVLGRVVHAQYLHFASHGVFEAERWIDSRLELGTGEAVTLRDISTCDLSQVRLVTLSACETGMSHLTGLQEEFLGFPVMFAAAGAHAVLSTLWRVDDLASCLLLEAFYRKYLDGLHAAIALNDARAWLRGVTAGELVARARAQRVAPKQERTWRPIECSGVIGRFEHVAPHVRPFHSPYYWAAFTLWQTD